MAPNFVFHFTALTAELQSLTFQKKNQYERLKCIISLVWEGLRCLETYFPAIFVGFTDGGSHRFLLKDELERKEGMQSSGSGASGMDVLDSSV